MIYGHRGARGEFPENTLEGIKSAIKLPIDGIEIDVVVTKDKQLIVSHNAYADHQFSLDPCGNEIEKSDRSHNFFKMDYSDILKYDVGLKKHPDFLSQTNYSAQVPLLSDVFDLLNDKVLPSFKLFFEVKSEQHHVGEYYPEAKDYAALLAGFLKENHFKGDLIVKSFDPLFLNEFYLLTQKKYKIGFLVDLNHPVTLELKRLSFSPEYYNPEFLYVDKNMVEELHGRNIKLVTWTVNDKKDYEKMIDLNVDGIISDYPSKFFR